MPDDVASIDSAIPITGRRLALPPGTIFNLQRSAEAEHELGAFRAWAGYKDLGSDVATNGQVLFQHVLSFGPSEESGRTGVHCHLAHVHIVIPSSGRGVFSYDGVVTEAVPGAVICQHGGTVHDQFVYSYAPASAEENAATPLSVDARPADAATQSFSFLELFVPGVVADVEIVAPEDVGPAEQATAWDHPYHAPDAWFSLQGPDDPEAAWRPLADRPQFMARDAGTWAPTGRIVETMILAANDAAVGAPLALDIPGETGGLEIYFVVAGSVGLHAPDGSPVRLATGDCLTCNAGLAGAPFGPSPDLRLLRFFVSSRAEALWERSPGEIKQLNALGPGIIRRRQVREADDAGAVNMLRSS